jgi:hypothetical protein
MYELVSDGGSLVITMGLKAEGARAHTHTHTAW